MKKGLLCITASLLLGTCLAGFAGGAVPAPPAPFFSDHIRLVASGALNIEPRTAILGGNVDQNQEINSGLNNDDVGVNYAIGLSTWLPLMTWGEQQLNAVVFTNYMPGNQVSAHHVANYALGSGYAEDTAYVKTRRFNLGVGVNYLRAFNHDFFMMAMIGAGISWWHAKAEFTAEDSSATDTGADHPGVDSANPFVTGELGVGMKLSEKSSVLAFVQGAWAHRDGTNILAANNDDNAYVNTRPSNWWLLIGVKFARAITL